MCICGDLAADPSNELIDVRLLGSGGIALAAAGERFGHFADIFDLRVFRKSHGHHVARCDATPCKTMSQSSVAPVLYKCCISVVRLGAPLKILGALHELTTSRGSGGYGPDIMG